MITAPVTLFWGENDLLADPRDVHALSQELPNLTGMHQVGDQYWSHLDFVWAIHAGSELNEPLIKMMTRF